MESHDAEYAGSFGGWISKPRKPTPPEPERAALDLADPAQQRALISRLVTEHARAQFLGAHWQLTPALEDATAPQVAALTELMASAQIHVTWPGQAEPLWLADLDGDEPTLWTSQALARKWCDDGTFKGEAGRIGEPEEWDWLPEGGSFQQVWVTPGLSSERGPGRVTPLVPDAELHDEGADETPLLDVTVYRAQRGPFDEPYPIGLGTYVQVTDAMRHAEDDYRDHHDPHRLDEVTWLTLDDDRVWLNAARDGEEPVPTEWHIQPFTAAGSYDPAAES